MSKWSEQKIYVYIALIFGVLFVFLTPPFQSPDEDSHFKKTYMVSKGVLYPTVKKQKSGNYIPKEMDEYINHKLEYMGKTEQKYEYSELEYVIKNKLFTKGFNYNDIKKEDLN